MKHSFCLVSMLLTVLMMAGCSPLNTSQEPAPEQAGAVSGTEQQVEVVPPETKEPQLFDPGSFDNPKNCLHCHQQIYDEWSHSMHSKAWTDPWYQPDFQLAHEETDGATDMLCGACHAPIAARTGQLPPADGSQFDQTSLQGISCDFCHTVSGIDQMYNMGQVSSPGNTKRGPRGDGRSLYHEVQHSELHTKADFCGACHMVIHPANGTRIIDTWEDWQINEYGQQGIRCQDCHMTPTPGIATNPGRSSLMGKRRETVAFHGFIGGSSYIQDAMGNHAQAEMSREFLRAAAELKLASKVTDDGTLELTVDVHNVGAGHKIPTGTTYIRIMWLQVEVTDAAGRVIYTSGQIDENNHVDPEATFFRVLFRDADGNLTGKSWRAESIGYDRRIPAKGMDSETYRIPLPSQGDYQVSARLMYRSMAQQSLDEIFTRTGQKLPPVASVEMASAQTRVKR